MMGSRRDGTLMYADTEIGFWRVGHHTVSGFSQFWRDWQPREGSCPPVLALHGSLTQSGMWIAFAETASTVRMLCPDQRGFGRSEDPGSDSCAEFASDALALAQDSVARTLRGHGPLVCLLDRDRRRAQSCQTYCRGGTGRPGAACRGARRSAAFVPAASRKLCHAD